MTQPSAKCGLAMAAVFLCAGAGLRVFADMYPRQPGIRILKYSFDVALGDVSDELVVQDTIDLQFAADDVRSINFDLCSLITEPQPADRLNPCLVPAPRPPRDAPTATPAPAPTSVGRGMTVTGVAANGRPLSFEHRRDRLSVTFPQPARTGSKLSITVSYHGVPATGLFIGPNRYGDRVFFTDNWPNKARNWLATIDHISVKAPKTIRVTAPRRYQVISNGLLTEQTDLPDNLRRTVWEETEPIPSWQFSLGVAQMAVHYFGRRGQVEFSAWLFPQNREAGRKAVDPLTQSVFEYYSDHIGPYGYEKLAHVEAAGGGGATEPATTIFYYGGFGALSHEMAHQWFGNAVTESDWDDVWLSEGFATYFALLYTEHQSGHDAFMSRLRRTREAAVNYGLAHPDDTVVHNNLARDSEVFFNSTQIYQGGAMVLHTLRGALGDEVFWAGIRLYYRRFYHGSATTDDLRRAMEDACQASTDCARDNPDLPSFFRQWLNRGGILQLDGTWHYDNQSKRLQIVLDQTQRQGLYRMPIEIGIKLPASSANPVQISRQILDQRHQVWTLPLEAPPSEVELDPNGWVPLMQAAFKRVP